LLLDDLRRALGSLVAPRLAENATTRRPTS
jgi:hypothetical protein